MTLKSDAKFEEKLTCGLQNDIRDKSNFYFNGFLLAKKITEELSFMTLKSDAKFEEKRTCGLENDMRNLANFQ